jgi:Zn-dependent protease
MDIAATLQTIIVYAIPTLFAITLHEVAHGWIAKRLGDTTAYMLGRLTINPLKHIDPVGTVLVPLLCLLGSNLAGGPTFLFGWAKPVPVNPNNLKSPKIDMAKVALAGPLCNLLQAIVWVILWRVLAVVGLDDEFFTRMMLAAVSVNLALMAFNLLPLPPLDGGRILVGILPRPYDNYLASVEPYGFMILLVLIFTNISTLLITPFYNLGAMLVKLFLF